MTFTEEQLQDIEYFGAVFFSKKEISIVMQLDLVDLNREFKNEQSAAYQRYHKGRLKSIYDIRLREIELAKNGSSQAQELAERHIKNLNLQDTDE